MSRLVSLLIAVFVVASGMELIAQEQPAVHTSGDRINGKGPAYTEPPEQDPNYNLMGEFFGEITAGEGEPELLGLQIRAIGHNEFDALSFFGGLPGQDNHHPEPIRMIGRRSDDFVVLSGGPWAIFVEKDACMLLDREGNKVGRLERIQRSSPTLHARPPKDSSVLFDGTNIDHFVNAQMTSEGLLVEGADIKPMFQDFNLHVEFRLPYMPEADGQQRGNSGLYLQSRYECQVLDSFALDPLYNGLGALYRFRAPDLNMCLPPLVWQTYDVQFTAPRWTADGTKLRDAHITSWINGVKIHDNVALPDKTGAGKPEEPLLLPIRLQDHGDPVRFRNIWIVDRGLAVGEFPIFPTKEELEAIAKAEEERAQKEKAEQEKELKQREEAEKKELDKKKAAEEKTKAEAEKAKANDKDQAKDTESNEPPANEPEGEPASSGEKESPEPEQPNAETADTQPADTEPANAEQGDDATAETQGADAEPANDPADA